ERSTTICGTSISEPLPNIGNRAEHDRCALVRTNLNVRRLPAEPFRALRVFFASIPRCSSRRRSRSLQHGAFFLSGSDRASLGVLVAKIEGGWRRRRLPLNPLTKPFSAAGE